jgi:hypothetical protein
MGSGHWSTDTYTAAKTYRATTGTSAFQYSDSGARTVHADLDPRIATVRESRDSADHPNSTPIAVWLDVTGSMASVPRQVVAKLDQLFGLLLRKGYVEHPQIMVGAIGDAYTDRAPLQVSQFESDNRIDENLGKLVLEGNGGGQGMETYELAMYFMARHTVTDAWEKRGKKGYMFITGDEAAYPRVDATHVQTWIGGSPSERVAGVPTEQIVAELQEKWHVFYILPAGTSYSGDQGIINQWKRLIGNEHVIELDDLNALCETIALTIGLIEGSIDLDDGLDDLQELGSTATGTVGKALAKVGAGRGALAKSVAPAGLDADDDQLTRI